MRVINEYTGDSERDAQCHICYREMSNHTPREVTVRKTDDGNRLIDQTKGVGMCPEHGVSYDEPSMKRGECRHCSCEKPDCPVCSGPHGREKHTATA